MTTDRDGTSLPPAALPEGCAVREAGRQDARLLAQLGERCFREAWHEYNTPGDMDAYCSAHFNLDATRADLGRPDVGFLVAECGGAAAGYLRWATGPAPDCVTAVSPLELSRIYVLRRWHGRGVGPALMAECLRRAREQGHDVAWLAVWQRAPQPLAFYRKWGFEVIGTATFRLGADVQDDYVMARGV
jgi:GNAT superfamily N-acetyltransferase